jgi:hypothetical protein
MIDASTVLDRPERIPDTGDPKEVGGLKITFGLDLDGYQDLQPRDRFNESICGPRGFLSLLELRLVGVETRVRRGPDYPVRPSKSNSGHLLADF